MPYGSQELDAALERCRADDCWSAEGILFRFTINWERFIVIIREKLAAGVRIIREGLSRKQREAEVGETWIRVSVGRVVL